MKPLSYRPWVVGSLTADQPVKTQLLRAARARVDLLEVRLDTFPFLYGPLPEACRSGALLLSLIRKSIKAPVLLTIRSPRERGQTVRASQRLTDHERAALFQALTPLADAVDFEIRSALPGKLTAWARRQKKAVIHSFHDFKTAGRAWELDRLRKQSLRLKGDFFKIAVTPRTSGQLENFLRWGGKISSPRPVLIGMGAAGLPSRYIGYSFGSAMTFGHLGAAAAPGQVSVEELQRVVRLLYPKP